MRRDSREVAAAVGSVLLRRRAWLVFVRISASWASRERTDARWVVWRVEGKRRGRIKRGVVREKEGCRGAGQEDG